MTLVYPLDGVELLLIVEDATCAAEMHVEILAPQKAFYTRDRKRMDLAARAVVRPLQSACPALGRVWAQGRASDSEYTVFLAILEPANDWQPDFVLSPRDGRT
jgi:hypothetical protein